MTHIKPLPIQGSRRLLTVAELAEKLNVSERHVRRMIAAGEIPVVRLRKAVRIQPEVADAISRAQ
jgi:excisionase family DNA binding protein